MEIKLACRVASSLDACAEQGLDAEHWIREGLVDVAAVSSMGHWQLGERRLQGCGRGGEKRSPDIRGVLGGTPGVAAGRLRERAADHQEGDCPERLPPGCGRGPPLQLRLCPRARPAPGAGRRERPPRGGISPHLQRAHGPLRLRPVHPQGPAVAARPGRPPPSLRH